MVCLLTLSGLGPAVHDMVSCGPRWTANAGSNVTPARVAGLEMG